MNTTRRVAVIGVVVGVIGAVVMLGRTPATAEQRTPVPADSHVAVTKPLDPPDLPVSARPRPIKRASADDIIRYGNPERLYLRSAVALVMDERESAALYARNIDEPRPIASLTKLMAALVILDARQPLNEMIQVTRADRDRLRGSSSRLRYGTVMTRRDLLHVALAASDNRAAAALARTYPGGQDAMIQAMNIKARVLGMHQTRFADASGLDSGSVSSARDLAKLVRAAAGYPLAETLSTSRELRVPDWSTGTSMEFRNTNYLVYKDSWDIALSKTGYTSDAGNCLVMRVTIAERPLIVVLLNSWGRLSKIGDSNRIRDWIIKTERRVLQLSRGTASSES